MEGLRQHMAAAQAKDAKEFETHGSFIMLQFLRDKAPHMVPLIDTVPVTAHAADRNMKFVGQELEDKILYQRFWNEHTQECHKFGGDAVFESGAYRGVEWSNTFFFEKHFGRKSILVEASQSNWGPLDAAVKLHRPLASVHHAAMCPLGDSSACLDSARAEHPAMHGVTRDDSTSKASSCQHSVPCFRFDETLDYALISLDIEGFEWEFLKFRHPKADIIIIEFAQWVRHAPTLLTAVEVITRLAQLRYYLYAPQRRQDMVGVRNMVFVSSALVDDCFAQHKIAQNTVVAAPS